MNANNRCLFTRSLINKPLKVINLSELKYNRKNSLISFSSFLNLHVDLDIQSFRFLEKERYGAKLEM